MSNVIFEHIILKTDAYNVVFYHIENKKTGSLNGEGIIDTMDVEV